MKKNEKDTIEDVLETKKKLPEEVKKNIMKDIFINCELAIGMMIIVLIVNFLFYKCNLNSFENYMKIVQIMLGLITVVIFEMSYRKDSFKISIYGIEFAIFSISILYVPYMYILNQNINFLRNIIIIFIIYYIIKSIFIFFYHRNKYLKENMSDVKEIVKKDKKGYIEEESKKTLKDKKKK